VVNVSLYIPLGFAAHLVFRKLRLPLFSIPLFSIYGPVLLGLFLSAAVELAQLYTPSRDTSLVDVASNVMGSSLGVVLALIFEHVARPAPRRARQLPVDRSALALAFCWGAWLLFPFFPVLGLYTLDRKIDAFAHVPLFAAVPFVSAAGVWFAAGVLISAAGTRRSIKVLGLSILALSAQFLIVDRQPVPSDFLGAIIGFLLFAFRRPHKPVTRIEAAAFSAVILFRGLAPFQFVAASTDFSWVPFGGVLNSEWQSAVLVLLGKIFYYATAIWLFHAAGVSTWQAIAFVAIILTGIEISQTHLPGRTPEITDPLLAVLMGFILFILFHGTGRRFRSAG
jgi:VanZ family protein